MIEQLLEELEKTDKETRIIFAKKIVDILNEASISTGKNELLI